MGGSGYASGSGYSSSGGGLTPSGIAYQRPVPTGQTTSYRTGDDAWHLANGTYDYTPPVYPDSFSQLDTTDASPYTTLKSNNAFGNTNRFTDENGLQVYGNDYAIDHLTGLGWYWGYSTNDTWDNQIDYGNALSHLTYSDYRLPNLNELLSIGNYNVAGSLNYTPFSGVIPQGSTEFSWTSTTESADTVSAFAVRFDTSGVISMTAVRQGKASGNYQCLFVRNHYN